MDSTVWMSWVDHAAQSLKGLTVEDMTGPARFVCVCRDGELDDEIRGMERNLRTQFPADEVTTFTRRLERKEGHVYVMWGRWK
jgi:hypothetical protein